jgi:hypothetical protein
MTDVPGRAPSGVRLAGDDYQHLVTLNEVLHAMRGNGVTAVTVEARDAGNVDDVVLHSDERPTRYTQMKHAVDGQTPVGADWLMKPARTGGKSLLQRFHLSWAQLGGVDRHPYLQLVTDRDIDPADPILKMVDRRTGLVVPAVKARNLREERADWAEHVGIDENELLTFLGDLRFVTGRSFHIEQERAALQLETLGLNSGQGAVDSGLAMVREWIQERERTIDIDELAATVAHRIGRRCPPGGLLVVEGIDDAWAAEDADVSLRFVERYEDADPFERRRLRVADDWRSVVWPEMNSAATRLRDSGHQRVIVDGAMRLPMWFGAGSALRDVRGFIVAVQQREQLWSSDDIGTSPALSTSLTMIGSGTDLAVAVGVSADPTREVLEHVEADPRIGQLLSIAPSAGPGNLAVPDGRIASAMVEMIRNEVRDVLDGSIDHLHLFLATPAGLALLLGHRWNALRPTTVYEHLGTGRGYMPTFVVPA